MCGISGLISAAPTTPADRALVARMNDALRHRGPDDEGGLETDHVLLAMRRLAIIDLAGAAQPLTSGDGRLTLVFNGEIYNYRELREALAAQGHAFRTKGDGEVILGLYDRHGLDFVHHLRGMFAIALWDAEARRLVLVRDRMGEKPLYLRETPGRIVFASEMKALVHAGGAPFAFDLAGVHLFFHYQYVPEPLTAVAGVRKLDAGHMLVVDLDPWRVAEHCYWRMADAPPLAGDPAALIGARLDEAGRFALRSDVPVGVALSGGLDSSVIAALAARHGRDVAAFSVGYPGRPANDERAEAEALAAFLGLPFHEIELSTSEAVDSFEALNLWRDDPIADIAGFGYYAVMRAAADQGVKVMLQGQGGDELFWGYAELRRARAAARRAGWRRAMIGPRHGSAQLPFYDKAPDYAYARRHASNYYTPDFAAAVAQVDPAAAFTYDLPWPDPDILLTERICATYLRGNGIAQGERLAMASSVELRLPFMDHKLIETVIGLRRTASDAGLPAKAWLKAAARHLVPAEILGRRKQGFAPPAGEWHAALFARYGGRLADGLLVDRGVLSSEGARALSAGPWPAGAIAPLSFKALVLELWARQMAGTP
jgi:asparagine synthase (glutamine-hydrolysing)